MIHTKEQIAELAARIFAEIGYDYFYEASIRPEYTEEERDMRGTTTKAWMVYADVPDEQFLTQKGLLILYIDDETLEPYDFRDYSGGRIPPLKLSKDEKGKYFISGNWG